MLGRIAVAALLAGLVGGLVVTVIQSFEILPLIAEAEMYEVDAGHTRETAEGHTHDHGGPWAPSDGLERFSLTALSNVLVGIGFALLLCAGAVLRGGLDWRQGLVWGLAGYAAVNLAPALGLPPELPGMRAAGLAERQLWWVMTAVGTAGGLALIAFGRAVLWKALGTALIVLPHAIGAPHVETVGSGTVPAELVAAFVTATLVANLFFWLVIGAVAGYVLNRAAATVSQ